MEHEFTKEQILETYLNVIFLGQRSYGVAAAAETYFGKPLDQLSLAEAATLAGLPQAPSRYNPITNPKAAQARRHYVLGQMLKLNYIDAASAQSRRTGAGCGARSRHHSRRRGAVRGGNGARRSSSAAMARMRSTPGYKVYTTIDGRLQTAADRAVRIGLIRIRSPPRLSRRAQAGNACEQRSSAAQFDALLASVASIGDLRPAVVVSVAQQSARVYIRGLGFAQIDWDGLPGPGGASRTRAPARRRSAPRKSCSAATWSTSSPTARAQPSSRNCPRHRARWWRSTPMMARSSALVGGFDYFNNKFNRAVQARRQPGSGFKPFLYSAALENGFTPSSIVMDAPIVYDDSGQEKIWRPENNEKGFEGPMRLREALVHSRNLVTIRVVRQLGVDAAIDYASKFGFDPQDMPKDMTIALGSLPATPLQMASGYAVFANGGYRIDPYFIERIEDAVGQTVYQAPVPRS